MNIPYRPLALGLLRSPSRPSCCRRAQAGGGHYYPPVTDPLVKEECGSCHLAFAPSMLPASSWKRMMGDLKNHFGDDASVDAAYRRPHHRATCHQCSRYRAASATAASCCAACQRQRAPLRITELPKWVSEHRKVPAWEWKHKDVRTKANCVACHADAARGYYDD